MSKAPLAPKSLSAEAKRLWGRLVSEYSFSDAASEALLRSLCETVDRVRECQAAISRDGLTVIGASGQPRPHPLLAVEAECRRVLLAHFRALRLEPEEV